jgi:Na+/H+ antiporter NhaB
MAESSLITIMTVFTGLAALALVGQCLALYGIYRRVRSAQDQLQPVIQRLEATLDSARTTLEQSRVQLGELVTRSHAVLDSAQTQLLRVDSILADAQVRTRHQLDKAEMVVGDTLDRVHEVVGTLHGGIMAPVREAGALVNALRAGFGSLFRTSKSSVVSATQDEEMFIG